MSNFVIKYDLPPASGNGQQALLLDANASNYSTLPNGGGIVFVERYAIRKPFASRQAINTPSTFRPETYLVKETNYTDVGGGWFEFERHYSEVPATWFDFKPISATVAVFSFAFTRWVLNPRFGSGRQIPIVATATRRYYLEEDLSEPGNVVLQPPEYELTGASVTFEDVIVSPDDVTVHLGKIYEVTRYTGTVSTAAPPTE